MTVVHIATANLGIPGLPDVLGANGRN